MVIPIKSSHPEAPPDAPKLMYFPVSRKIIYISSSNPILLIGRPQAHYDIQPEKLKERKIWFDKLAYFIEVNVYLENVREKKLSISSGKLTFH